MEEDDEDFDFDPTKRLEDEVNFIDDDSYAKFQQQSLGVARFIVTDLNPEWRVSPILSTENRTIVQC